MCAISSVGQLLQGDEEAGRPAVVSHPPAAMSICEKAPLLAQDKTSVYSLHRSRKKPQSTFRLVIHGGAGTMDKSRSTPELRAQYKTALSRALLAGYAVLQAGGEAMDAAVAAVSSMEGACSIP